jgi:hypothetical protein
MVDGRYWGRDATGKTQLTDAQVLELHNQRRRGEEGFGERLLVVAGLDPGDDVQARKNGRGLWRLEPVIPLNVRLPEVLAPHVFLTNAISSLGFRPNWHPGIESPVVNPDDPDGFAAWSQPPGSKVEEKYLLRLLAGDDNRMSVLPGHGTQNRSGVGEHKGQYTINVPMLAELSHQLLRVPASLSAQFLDYIGPWRVGVHLDNLRGLPRHAGPARRGTGPRHPLPQPHLHRDSDRVLR